MRWPPHTVDCIARIPSRARIAAPSKGFGVGAAISSARAFFPSRMCINIPLKAMVCTLGAARTREQHLLFILVYPCFPPDVLDPVLRFRV